MTGIAYKPSIRGDSFSVSAREAQSSGPSGLLRRSYSPAFIGRLLPPLLNLGVMRICLLGRKTMSAGNREFRSKNGFISL